MVKKLLIIEDDFDILEGVSYILEEEGYVVKGLSLGKKALNETLQFKPDIILLDILISGIDGRMVSKILKNNKRTKHIPIIIISAHPEAKKTSFSAGANYFLEKPFEVDTLKQLIRKALSD